jgi:hypothetical protein
LTRAARWALEKVREKGFDAEAVGKIEVRRTRAGRWQRYAGAWSWWLQDDRRVIVGSQWSLRDLMTRKDVQISLGRYGDIVMEPVRS